MASPLKSSTNDAQWTLVQFKEDDAKLPIVHVHRNTMQAMNRTKPQPLTPGSITAADAMQLLCQTANQVHSLSQEVGRQAQQIDSQGQQISDLVQTNLNLKGCLDLHTKITTEKIDKLKRLNGFSQRWGTFAALCAGGAVAVGPVFPVLAAGFGASLAIADAIWTFPPEGMTFPTDKQLLDYMSENSKHSKEEALIALWQERLEKDNISDAYATFLPSFQAIQDYKSYFRDENLEAALRFFYQLHQHHHHERTFAKENEYLEKHPQASAEEAIRATAEIEGRLLSKSYVLPQIKEAQIQAYMQRNAGGSALNRAQIGSSYYHTIQRDATREEAFRDLLLNSRLEHLQAIQLLQESLFDGDSRGSELDFSSLH